MPNTDSHLQQATRNESFVSHIEKATEPFTDWALTGLFYSAVHYAEAFFALSNTHSLSHPSRSSLIGHRFPRSISIAYEKLRNAAYRARYMCVPFGPDDIIKGKKNLEIFKEHIKKSLP